MDLVALRQTKLLRAEEVAEMLSIGKSTVYALARAGKLPSIQIGGSVRIPASDLQKWLEARRSLPNGQDSS